MSGSAGDRGRPIRGVRLGAAQAGIKRPGRYDVLLIEVAAGGRAAAVFTRNAFCAAPVTLSRAHLREAMPRYLLVNSGNANAGTGERGLADARDCCRAVAALTGCREQEVLPFSTGVIGEPLPVEKIEAALPAAIDALAQDNWEQAAGAIMTTDTVPKLRSRVVTLPDGREVGVTGIAKGAGMIRPDMATMLAYVATDAPVAQALLARCLRAAADKSFNRVTIDGDTSTNDACVLIATGAAGGSEIASEDDPAYAPFVEAIEDVCVGLAQAIVRDGEGATKFISVRVTGGAHPRECLDVAYTVAHSPLVKTAFFASDPNWGRLLAAVGRAGLADLDIARVAISLNGVRVAHQGGRDPAYTEAAGRRAMAPADIEVLIELGRGDAAETVWTCDFSYDYVKINAEYRT